MKIKNLLNIEEWTTHERYPIGYRFIRYGKKRGDVETVVDIYTTKNSKGDTVKVTYVTEHDFMGQKVRDEEVLTSTIARSQEVK